ncbi:MAG TPA: Scr1 family TA system antitoxin-like transcriptional regulator [Micromonospora sp.]|nr:Scr1 family TA system antitoxin-like transcriptional regulator [Micromonospora sp.]
MLRREHPPQYDVVIDEAAFRRNTAPPEVLRGQLRYLISIAELDNVSVQWQLC